LKELKEIRWPKMGDNPFMIKDGDRMSPAWVSLEWLASMGPGDTIYAEAFKTSADKLVSLLCQENNKIPSDMYFMPITYLYRHSLELKLKEIINLGLRLQLIEQDVEISDDLKRHEFIKLWKHARIIIEKYWPNSPKQDVSSATGIVQSFHNIDKSGQSLRYSQNISGKSNMKGMPRKAELTQIRDVFDAIYNFLGGCQSGLIDATDCIYEEY
jgi:hypothetical protein